MEKGIPLNIEVLKNFCFGKTAGGLSWKSHSAPRSSFGGNFFGKRKNTRSGNIRRRECYRIGYCEWSVKAKSIYSSWKDISKDIKIWDRIDLILDIFDRHANSEAKAQIKLARLHHDILKFMPENLQRSLNAGAGIGTREQGTRN